MAEIQLKRGRPQGGTNWKRLETAGDIRRALRQLYLDVHANKMDIKKAAVLGQIACYLLRSVEVSTLEGRMTAVEQSLDTEERNGITHPSSAH